jgi:hypothetical protein
MKKILFGLLIVLLSGCTTLKLNQAVADAHDPKVVQAYEKTLNDVIKEVQNDPSYKRIPLDSKAEVDWFITQAFLYWDKKISRDEFVKRGVTKYPGYKESFEYLADRIKQDK